MKTGIYAVVQCRRGSSRFPDKVLADICGKTMFQRVLERVQACELLETVIMATSTRTKDVLLLSMAKDMGVESFAGSENDVLDRYYQCSKEANTVVRVSSDCPLIDPGLISGVLQYHLICCNDYTSSRPSYPDGFDIEVMTTQALKQAWEEAQTPYDREHVTPYIITHPEIFKVGKFSCDVDFPPELHWSVDYPEDLTFMRWVYETLGEEFTFQDLITTIELLGGQGAKELCNVKIS